MTSLLFRKSILAVLALGLASCLLMSCKDQGTARQSSDPDALAGVRGEPINAPIAEPAKEEPAPAEAPVEPAPEVPANPQPDPTPAAPASVEVKVAAATPAAEQNASPFQTVGFDKLASFSYEIPESPVGPESESEAKLQEEIRTLNTQIPETVRKFDKQDVALKGFMLPLKVEGGLVTELLVMRDQSMCCFGTVPKINEWVSVKMVEAGVKAVMDEPITLFGQLHVGEILENGYLVGIYRMDGKRMEVAKE